MYFLRSVHRAILCKTSKIVLNRINFLYCKSDGTKVVLVGARNTVGINVAFLLKKTNLFSEICLHDFFNTRDMKGITSDLNYIHTPSVVTFHRGKHALDAALKDANLVVVLDRILPPDKSCRITGPDAEETRIFKANADVCSKVAEAYAKHCPGAILTVVAKPVNCMTPLMSEIASKLNHNVNSNKILGFALMDEIRSNLLLSKKLKKPLHKIKIPIIGGSSKNTVIPLLSTIKYAQKMNEEQVKKFTEEVRKGTAVYNLKMKSPLATAAAVGRFVITLARALKGEEGTEHAYVASDITPESKFFTGKVRLGPAGIQVVNPIPKLSEYEQLMYESAMFYLKIDTKRGEDYAETFLLKKKC